MPKGDEVKVGGGCAALLSLPFVGVGLLMLYFIAFDLAAWRGMRDWIETPARVRETQLIESDSDDSTTYRVTAVYEYEFGGRAYTGTRVAIGGGSDNVGSFQRRMHERLAAHRQSGAPMPCYVNPRNPAEAILHRGLRWEMLVFKGVFGLAFGSVGLGVGLAGLSAKRLGARDAREQGTHGDRPWMQRPEWAEGRIRYSAGAPALFMSGFALFWNLISWPMLIPLLDAYDEGNTAALIGLVFPGVGLLLFGAAAQAVLKWRKFGVSTFEMASVPGVIGSTLEGVLHLPAGVPSHTDLHLSLDCVERTTSGSGKNRSTSERLLLQDVQRVRLERRDPAGARVPVRFGIPADAQSTHDGPGRSILWRVQARASIPGLDYDAQFEAPVYHAVAPEVRFQIDPAPTSGAPSEADLWRQLAAAGLHVQPLASGGLRLDASMARYPGVAVALTVFLAMWLGIAVVLFRVDAPLIFPVLFGAFGALLLYFVLDLWFGSSRVEASFQLLTVTHRMLGIQRTRSFYYQDIKAIAPERGMQAGQRLYYDVLLETTGSSKYKIFKSIDNLDMARRIAGAIESALGNG